MRCWVCGQASRGVLADSMIVCFVLSVSCSTCKVVLLLTSCKSSNAHEAMVC